MASTLVDGALPRKRVTLYLLAAAELLAMAVWFSASVVAPQLAAIWHLSAAGHAWLTISVQLGFVAGAFVSSLFSLADRIAAHRLFASTAIAAALATFSIVVFIPAFPLALALRFLTGFFLAGVYPVGMKIMATWTQRDRGWGIGLLVGALTLGSAFPHLLRLFGQADHWQPILTQASLSAALGGVIAGLWIREGPYRAPAPPFRWRMVGDVLRERNVMLANLGYLGHMWEVYAMWTWIPAFIVASFRASGVATIWTSLAAFVTIASGAVGSLAAGILADRIGRTRVINASLIVSGACCLAVGFFFGRSPIALMAILVIWGISAVADSAQFSACVTELCPKDAMGTAVTLQTCLGFLLTTVTLRLVPVLESRVGWRWAFAVLALGPMGGVWAITKLGRRMSGAAPFVR